ncbi:MAG: tRNA-dihydrouridine synthase [Candidatus Parcubacteria bacterium]|nr:tRNA-dihydrouridine synthase [Candidatus Parcubacteria bacterium]
MSNFWQKLPLRQAQGRPFFALAPMADVTDAAFRRIIAKYGKPDVLWTEFVACDGLMSEGREHLMHNLSYSEEERPIIAQVFGANPENFEKTARFIKELGFDGIDINMGCPEKNIQKQGAGASLIKTPKLAQEIILATIRGAGDMPVSVKTRIGYHKNELETWLPALLETKPATITLHARTKKEMSDVPARWEHVARAVEIRNEMKSKTLIIGNGDIKTLEEGRRKAKETGCDGIMIGRGIFGNPWLFSDRKDEPTREEKFAVLLEHTHLFEELFGKGKNFAVMKKHYKAYIEGFHGAKELRMKLMEAENGKQVESILKTFSLGGETAK